MSPPRRHRGTEKNNFLFCLQTSVSPCLRGRFRLRRGKPRLYLESWESPSVVAMSPPRRHRGTEKNNFLFCLQTSVSPCLRGRFRLRRGKPRLYLESWESPTIVAMSPPRRHRGTEKNR